VGGRARPRAAGLPDRLRDRCRRLRARRRGAADGAGVRHGPDAHPRGALAQDFDYYEIHEAFASQVLSTLKAWEDPVFCKERLGLDRRSARSTGRSSTCRLLARCGPPVRRTAAGSCRCWPSCWRPPRGHRPRRDLDLRGRRPGRHAILERA
jgi:hypothetical protein